LEENTAFWLSQIWFLSPFCLNLSLPKHFLLGMSEDDIDPTSSLFSLRYSLDNYPPLSIGKSLHILFASDEKSLLSSSKQYEAVGTSNFSSLPQKIEIKHLFFDNILFML
jgi:hypothetical protein